LCCKEQEKKKNKESKAKHCRASHFVKSISLGEFIFGGTKRVATQYSRVFGISKHPSPLYLPVPQSNKLNLSNQCEVSESLPFKRKKKKKERPEDLSNLCCCSFSTFFPFYLFFVGWQKSSISWMELLGYHDLNMNLRKGNVKPQEELWPFEPHTRYVTS